VAASTVQALVLQEPRTLVDRQFPRPDLGEDDGLLRVEACGLCGTDHEQFTGALPGGFAFVPGHETVGVIEAVGPAAADRWGVEEGDRVAVEVFLSCRACPPCRAGEYRHCRRHGIGDMYGYIPADRPPGLWGGYAELQYLAPDSILHVLPSSLDPVLATVFNPLGAGIHACGSDPATALKRATGGLADIVVDVTAKAPAALAQAIGLARPGGTVVVAGTRGSPDTPGFWPDLIVYKELRILGALGVDAPAYRAAIELLASGRFPFADLPRRCERLGGAGDLLRAMAGEGDDPAPVHGVLVP
jgi:alcohol dehydrogenase